MAGRETVPSGIGWDLFQCYVRALEKYKPDYFLYENNKSISKEIQACISEVLGVEPVLINSSLVSAQNRERLYWTNIPGVGQPKDRGLLLRDIVLPVREVPDKYWYDYGFVMTGNQSGVVCVIDKPQWLDIMRRVYSLDSKSPTLNTVGGGNQQAKVFQAGRCRKLTPVEYARLQMVPDSYIFPVSDAQKYKMLGNGWTIDVISHILGHIPGINKEQVDVLSLFDGMACGRIALDKLGVSVKSYSAYEIDKYAIKTVLANYPDVQECGDVFSI